MAKLLLDKVECDSIEVMRRESIKVGTKIRSYDFMGVRDCYREGVVVSIDKVIPHPCGIREGVGYIEVSGTVCVREGQVLDACGETFYTPLITGLFEYPERIEVLN